MSTAASKRLVFRLAGIGFSLAIKDLLEIIEAGEGVLDETAADADLGLLGLIAFRDEAIYLHDILAQFGLVSDAASRLYLVVVGGDGAWALPVEKIEGIFPAAEFRSLGVPPLLAAAPLPFSRLDLWRGEPLVGFEPMAVEHWRGAV